MAETNVTEIADRIGWWNWSASDKVQLSVVEKLPLQANISENIALIHVRQRFLLSHHTDSHNQGKIELTDANTSEDLRLDFEGVHFISNGSMYGFAEPIG